MKIHPWVAKTFAVSGVILLLVIALDQVGGLVRERQARAQEAEQSVEQSLAGRQTLLGPVLMRSCTEEWTTPPLNDRVSPAVQRREFNLSATPRRLEVNTQATMDTRHRGLFQVNGYLGHLEMNAQWDSLDKLVPHAENPGAKLSCQPPRLMLALSDARGIRHASVRLGGTELRIEAGTSHAIYRRGLHAWLPEDLAVQPESHLRADIQLDLVGTGGFGLVPIADDTKATLGANWPHPSFGGQFLPLTQEISRSDFKATWQVSSLATAAASDFEHNLPLCTTLSQASAVQAADIGCVETFDVGFIDPVNPYTLSDRAIKYGLLFIGLTFLAVGMVEVLRRLRVHPIQYLLVGCAVSIFFLLLLSLSEHLSFGLSYGLAAGACVTLLVFYARYLLGGLAAGLAFGGGVATLYGALYGLLQLEQTALVLGSVLLFTVLAGVMMLTRRVDWYALLAEARGPSAETAKAEATDKATSGSWAR